MFHRLTYKSIANSIAPSPASHFVEHLARILVPFTTIADAAEQQQQQTPPADFLHTSCGLSLEAALSIANKFNLKPFISPHSVVAMLKQFGYTTANIADMVKRYPRILNIDADNYLKPKLKFFRRIGIEPTTIATNPQMLHASMERRFLPNFKLLKSVLIDKKKLDALLKRAPIVLKLDLETVMMPKIRILQDYNVPHSVLSQMIVYHTRAFYSKECKFLEALEAVKKIGRIGPHSPVFAHVLGVFAQMPSCFWERNMVVYRELGWSEDQVIDGFLKFPGCMAVSVDKLRKTLHFFDEKLNWGPDVISVHPVLLSLSLEKRLVPRYEAWKLLVPKGFLSSKLNPRFFIMTEKTFLEKYVSRCMDEVPEILDILRSSIIN